MKRILLTLGLVLLASNAYAGLEEWNYIPRSSFTAAATPGTVLFTSAPVQFEGITMDRVAAGAITIYRSTSPNFFTGIATQTAIDTGGIQIHFPLFNMRNTSYTYINKQGRADITIWFRCVGATDIGVCPGLD